jgi:hypothetical protein
MYTRLQSLKTILEQGRKDELQAELDGILHENKGAPGMEGLVSHLNKGDTKAALAEIRLLMAAKQPPVRKADADIKGLQTQLMLCQTRLSVLNHKKQDLLRVVNLFRLKHNQELGSLMTRMLFLRKELLFLEMGSQKAGKEEYEEAEREYTRFREEHHRKSALGHYRLSEEDQKEIALLYRQASKLCHPDVVADDLREEAESIFAQLNAAYVSNDAEGVRSIWKLLMEEGIKLASRSEEVKETDRLKAQIRKAEKEMDALIREISHIEESPAYQTITSVEDQDRYFAGIRERLEKELEGMEATYAARKGTEED